MLLTLIIILVLIGAAVVGSIYSSFMVFYSNFSESENYHKAYYSSISAVERGELVVKQRAPGYVGSGGWKLGSFQGEGSMTNGRSDGIIEDTNDQNFSYLSNTTSTKNTSTIFWKINSRASRIPSEGKGNIEPILSADDSKNYNIMDYENAEVFLLYYDNSSGNPYGSPSFSQSRPEKIEGTIRLPKKLKETGFNDLNSEQALIGRSNELPKDDAIVDRQIKGIYNNGGKFPFTIFSTQKANGTAIDYSNDTIFREKDINRPLNFNFSVNWNPLNSTSHGGGNPKTIISPKESQLANSSLKEIFKSNNISEKQIRLSLLNLLKDSNNPSKIYPFLEYYIDFGDSDVSDKYFTIEGEGNYGDYQTNIIIQKPTVNETVLRNFTSIF